MPTMLQRAEGGMLASACGDALAVNAEFNARGSYHITGMGSVIGSFPTGGWSDDTGLMLCLAKSLIAKKGFDAKDQMQRYVDFYSIGRGWEGDFLLKPGRTLAFAFRKFEKTGEPYSGSSHPLSAGNGGLMRLLPEVLASHSDKTTARQWSVDATRTTHGAPECLESSELLSIILLALLQGEGKEAALLTGSDEPWSSEKIAAIAKGEYFSKQEELISASAYVVNTLEAALWCFYTTNTLEEAVLKAANLGGDCDTVACVTGKIAGCFYGVEAIPFEWLEVLDSAQDIRAKAKALIEI